MGNFEEVKKKIEIWQRNPDIYLGHGKGYRKMTIDDLALQICQLFELKPDESRLQQYDPKRLIIDEDKMAMSDTKNRWLHSSGTKTTFENDCIDEIIYTQRAIQDATTASIKDAEFAKVLGDSVKAWHERLKEKDAECQERVERIFEIVDGKTATRNEVDIKDKKVKLFRLTRISNEEWQALLGREGVK